MYQATNAVNRDETVFLHGRQTVFLIRCLLVTKPNAVQNLTNYVNLKYVRIINLIALTEHISRFSSSESTSVIQLLVHFHLIICDRFEKNENHLKHAYFCKPH